MKNIMHNEFLKFSKSKYMYVFMILLIVPLLMVFGSLSNKKTAAELYFTYYCQFLLFFPISIGLMAVTVFYGEFKNKTYLNWITNGISRSKLYAGKFIFSILLSALLIVVNYLILISAFLLTSQFMSDKLTIKSGDLIHLTISYFVFTSMVAIFTILYSSIFILATKNIVISTVFVFILTMISTVTMASKDSYLIPFAFPYRLGLKFIHTDYYYENVAEATTMGIPIYLISLVVLWAVIYIVMKHKKVIETN